MEKRRILIIDENDELRATLEQVLLELGHDVVAISDRAAALAREDLEGFDLIISDLTDETDSGVQLLSELRRKRLFVPVVISSDEARQPNVVKAFKMGATNYLRVPYHREELSSVVEKALAYKLRFVEDLKVLPYVREKIEFDLPSDLSLMSGVLPYLMERIVKLGIVKLGRSNLFIALDEAVVNAVRHGNKSDPAKRVRITAELSPKEARFVVEDEGEGFDIRQIPDPRDPANLFKTSGRGVFLIFSIMDEVEYSDRGNRVTMIKRPEDSLTQDLIGSLAEDTRAKT